MGNAPERSPEVALEDTIGSTSGEGLQGTSRLAATHNQWNPMATSQLSNNGQCSNNTSVMGMQLQLI